MEQNMIVVIGKGKRAKAYDTRESAISVQFDPQELKELRDNPHNDQLFSWPVGMEDDKVRELKLNHTNKMRAKKTERDMQ